MQHNQYHKGILVEFDNFELFVNIFVWFTELARNKHIFSVLEQNAEQLVKWYFPNREIDVHSLSFRQSSPEKAWHMTRGRAANQELVDFSHAALAASSRHLASIH